MALTRTVFLLAFGIYGFSGCCASREPGSFAKPYSIEYSSGGGVSGYHTGFILSSSGSISYWRGFRGEKEFNRMIGTIAMEDLLRCKDLIDRAGLSRLAIREAGNMTTTLRVTDGEEFFTLSWAGADSDPVNVPAQVRPVFELLQTVLAPFRERALDIHGEQE